MKGLVIIRIAIHIYSLARSALPKPLKHRLKRVKILRMLAELLGALRSQYLAPSQPYEPDVCAAIESTVKHGWVCVDVGAHVGRITSLLARLVGPAGRVIAFEAHPANVEQLRHNVGALGFATRVLIENIAISDGTRDRVRLFAGRSCRSAEWNIVGHDVEGRKSEPELEVPAISLDKYFSPDSHIDFVKIDIEGAEAQALAGMKRLLREERPVVLVEFHDEVGWGGRQELYAAGYYLYDMDARKLDPVIDTQRIYHCLALASEQNK